MTKDNQEGNIFKDPLTDTDDLYYRAALLLRDIDEWHKENPGYRGDDDNEVAESMRLSPEEAQEKLPEELVSHHKSLETFLEIVSAHPDFRKLIINWIVEIDGYDQLSEERIIPQGQATDTASIKDTLGSIGGFHQAVSSFLKKEKYEIYEQTLGADGWSIGLLCNEKASNKLCEKLHERFKKAIDRGLLRVRKAYWGYMLRGLNINTYKEYLSNNDYYEEDEIEFEIDDDFAEFLEDPQNIIDDDDDDEPRFLDFGEFSK